MIIKTKKQNTGSISRDRKRYKTSDKALKRVRQWSKYKIG
jgi:hypothetical protein